MGVRLFVFGASRVTSQLKNTTVMKAVTSLLFLSLLWVSCSLSFNGIYEKGCTDAACQHCPYHFPVPYNQTLLMGRQPISLYSTCTPDGSAVRAAYYLWNVTYMGSKVFPTHTCGLGPMLGYEVRAVLGCTSTTTAASTYNGIYVKSCTDAQCKKCPFHYHLAYNKTMLMMEHDLYAYATCNTNGSEVKVVYYIDNNIYLGTKYLPTHTCGLGPRLRYVPRAILGCTST